MLPYSREVYFTLFGELNTRFAIFQGIALLLFGWTVYALLKPRAGHPRMVLGPLAVLWAGCAFFWFYRVFAEVNFLAPAYAAIAGLQALALGIASALPASREAPGPHRMAAAPLILMALAWPLLDGFTGLGWPHVRAAGLHLVPLLWLTLACLPRLSFRWAVALGLIPCLLAAVSAFEAYVLPLPQDGLPLLGFAVLVGIHIRNRLSS